MIVSYHIGTCSEQLHPAIRKKIFKILETHIGTEHNFGAWFFLVCLTEFQDWPEPKFMSEYFIKRVNDPEHELGTNIDMLVVEAILLNWAGIDPEAQNVINSKLRTSVETFTVPLVLISRYIDICFIANSEETKIWCGGLIKMCEDYIKNYIAPGCNNRIYEPSLCQYIHTLGDATHFHPGVERDVINCLANVIDHNSLIEGMNSKWKGRVSNTTKAVAIVALGKICLQDHFIAKTYAPVLAQALANETAKVKINSMIALTDLCVRFTSVVEDYLGEMCTMLKDPDVNVRENTLKLLLQLLQQDYLKPKGALFFYLLITLRDPVSSVREMSEAFIGNVLLKRNPSIMSQFFIQAIFFFNDYEGIGSFNKEGLSAKERRVFSMAGVRYFEERGNIYKFMLSNMLDDHRFKVCNRICVDILDEVNDGNIPLERVGCAVLKDALFAMSCDEMRLENLRKVEETEELEDVDEGRSETVLGIAKKAFISQIVKANYVECIVPTITTLKRMLAEKKSPLVRDLMICLRELMKDFREEINQILHADPELAAEVAFDLKDICIEEEPVNDLYSDFNLRELRVSCERLSEKALSEKMGISIASIKSLQSQSMALFNSQSSAPASSPTKHKSTIKQSSLKNTTVKRNSNIQRRLSVNNSKATTSSMSCSSSSPDSELKKLSNRSLSQTNYQPSTSSSSSPIPSTSYQVSSETLFNENNSKKRGNKKKRASVDTCSVTSSDSIKQVQNKKRIKKRRE